MFHRHFPILLPFILAGWVSFGATRGWAQMPGETDSAPPPESVPQTPDQAPPDMNAAQDSDEAANGTPGVNFQTFYDSLSGQGTWIQTAQFGYVWQPNVNDPQWAPYTDGHWVYSDAGWTWVSNEPWGWATYHYGRWVNLQGTGWCWVPGYTWAPAWVSWRYGDGYVGWAPLPPDSLIGVDYDADDDSGFHIGGDCDSYYDIGAGWYCFLPLLYLGEPDYRHFYVDRYHNYRLINHTTNVTNLNVTRGGARGGGVFAAASLGGPSLRAVDAAAQTPVAQVNLAFTNRVGGGAVSGGSLALYAPRVHAAATRQAPANFHSVDAAVINRGTDPTRPLMTTSHVPGVTPSADQIRKAQAAQATAPADARVATPGVSAPSFQSAALTTMRPAGAPPQPSYSRPDSGHGYSASPGGGNYRSSPGYNTAPRSYPSGGGTPGYGGGGNSGARNYNTGGNAYPGGASPHAGEGGSSRSGGGTPGTTPGH